MIVIYNQHHKIRIPPNNVGVRNPTITTGIRSSISSKSKLAESPTKFEEREKRQQKEYSCVENLNQERISPSDTSLNIGRITPAAEGSSASVARMSRLFKCPYCNYSSKWKPNLTLHVNGHKHCANCDIKFDSNENFLAHKEHNCSTRPDQESINSSSLPTPTPSSTPAAEASSVPLLFKCPYCSYSSDWQARLNRHVHKVQYCSARHVPESSDSSSSPTSTQQLQQPQNQQQHPTYVPNQPRFPGSNSTTTAATSESESESKGFNMVLNQPLYAAISTSPLILVPCSYVAGGGLSLLAGLIPAGNIIIPNPSTTPESNSDSQGGNVIPTYTVMPGTGVAELNSVPFPVSGDDVVKEEENPMKPCKEKVAKHVASKSPREQSEEEAEKPLDLSFKKQDVEFEKSIAPKSSTDTDN
ncbi:hypothetical protein CDAR_399381 [Caerostris darwini]|uniref:C2H2-type domain-containing protein n=1 Tax=Caerostris darwini TaxID=1538125 RepID=A0AAV4SVV1_9ARAC|nr:hypothetical protein CDAR_399381 [Caerostris darwini]